MYRVIEILFLTNYIGNLYSNKVETDLDGDDLLLRDLRENSTANTKEFQYSDYLKKYEPRIVWEQIDKQRKYLGRKISDAEQTELMCRGIDSTDEILNLKIENGDAKMLLEKNARRGWKAPPGLGPHPKDGFNLRRRLYELMKQAIYQTRNKMVIMQIYREKYNLSALYRMGFLMNKADNAVKTFGKFSFRAFRACLLSREFVIQNLFLKDLLLTNERQLTLWFNLELLVDLIKKNDDICKEIFVNQTENRKLAFNLHFIP